MKRLLLIFLFIPALLHGQSKEEKELEKRVKGMTKEKAESILMQAKVAPHKGGGWKMTERESTAIAFRAVGGLSGSFKLMCLVFVDENGLHVSFFMDDPEKLMDYLVLDNGIIAKCTAVAFIEANSVVGFIYEKNSDLVKLNLAFVPKNKKNKEEQVNFGKIIATNDLITINTGRGTAVWALNNQEALFAAAYALKPGITFKDFLSAIEPN